MASIPKPSRSTRRKPMPVPACAGRIRRATCVPLCKPTPKHPTGVRTVCSNGKLFQMKRLHRHHQAEVLFFYNRPCVLGEKLAVWKTQPGAAAAHKQRLGKNTAEGIEY